MFNNLINSIKSKVQPVKAISNSGLMSGMESMSAIKDAQSKTSERDEDKENKFLEVCNEGIKIFQEFAEDHQKIHLKKAMEKFLEAREIKTNRVEPYFYLSCIAYILADHDLSIKYLQIAKGIDSEFQLLKDFIEEINSFNDDKYEVFEIIAASDLELADY